MSSTTARRSVAARSSSELHQSLHNIPATTAVEPSEAALQQIPEAMGNASHLQEGGAVLGWSATRQAYMDQYAVTAAAGSQTWQNTWAMIHRQCQHQAMATEALPLLVRATVCVVNDSRQVQHRYCRRVDGMFG